MGKPAATDRPCLPSLSHSFTLDLVLLCRTQAEAEAALALVQDWTWQHGLRLHPEKTRVVDSSQGGYGFAFLGYRFARGRRHVRRKSLMALRDKSVRRRGVHAVAAWS